jgi:hypothetical protein
VRWLGSLGSKKALFAPEALGRFSEWVVLYYRFDLPSKFDYAIGLAF